MILLLLVDVSKAVNFNSTITGEKDNLLKLNSIAGEKDNLLC